MCKRVRHSVLVSILPILLIFLVLSILFTSFGHLQLQQHQPSLVQRVYATTSNTTLYFDCGQSSNSVNVEALPVTPNAVYTMEFIDVNDKLNNYTTTDRTHQAKLLGNGQGVFIERFTVASKANDIFAVALYNGTGTNTSPITKGASSCIFGNTAEDVQQLEQQCIEFVSQHNEINGIRLTDKDCKDMVSGSKLKK
jgi:hypothetical protein